MQHEGKERRIGRDAVYPAEMAKSIEDIDPVVFDRVWRIVTEIGSAERQFNSLQQTYRALASTWLLATFGAAGFVIEKLAGSAAGSVAGIVAAIGFCGGFGITLLWNLDLLVYHRLLDSFFSEGVRLERTYEWLPPFRLNMLAVHRNQGVLPKVVWFYAGSAGVLLLLANAALFQGLTGASFWARVLTVTAGVIVSVAIIIFMVRRTTEQDVLQRREVNLAALSQNV